MYREAEFSKTALLKPEPRGTRAEDDRARPEDRQPQMTGMPPKRMPPIRFCPARRPSLALAAALAATLSLSACDAVPATLKTPGMTALSPRLQPLFAKTKPVCFAQFVLDVPATATVVYGPAQVDANIDRYPGETEKIPEFIAERQKKIEEDRKYLEAEFLGPESMYGKVIDGAVHGQKVVVGESQDFYKIHSYVPIGPDLFVLEIHSIPAKGSKVHQEIAALNVLASQLRARAEDEVPAEPGSCIDGGFITGPVEYERVTLGVRLAEFPDVHFSIMVIRNQQYLSEVSELDSRLKRAEEEARLEGDGAFYARIKFFRRAPRKLGAWNGFEAVARKPARDGASESHEFLYYSIGALNDTLQPVLDVQLDTGVQGNRNAGKPPSITDEEAVALWDKLLGSIRPHPAAAKASGQRIPADDGAATTTPGQRDD